MIRAVGARSVTCSSRTPKPFALLLSLAMKEGETLRAYSDHSWELYNEMGEIIGELLQVPLRWAFPLIST